MKFVIRNKAQAELGIMLEPWCDRVDVPPGAEAEVEFTPDETDIHIDMGDDTFLSLWVPPGAKLNLVD